MLNHLIYDECHTNKMLLNALSFKIKEQVRSILDELTKLHAYVSMNKVI